jgi:phospho-N-acetylmuramoyl-pentapeptide-transferase
VIRLLLAVGIATVVSLIGTKVLIVLLTRRKIGQPIHEDVPEGHMVKAGTPTMGGVAIVAGALAGYLVSNLYDGVFTWTGIASMVAIAGAGVVGLFDDWLKVAKERNLGLNKRAKMIGLLLVAVVFVVLMLTRTNVHTTISFTVWYDLGWDLGDRQGRSGRSC